MANTGPPLLPLDIAWSLRQHLPNTFLNIQRADVGFADGHVLPVAWKFGLDPANSRADYRFGM
jgi:prepilin-type processing-associated H-X9-DG protein